MLNLFILSVLVGYWGDTVFLPSPSPSAPRPSSRKKPLFSSVRCVLFLGEGDEHILNSIYFKSHIQNIRNPEGKWVKLTTPKLKMFCMIFFYRVLFFLAFFLYICWLVSPPFPPSLHPPSLLSSLLPSLLPFLPSLACFCYVLCFLRNCQSPRLTLNPQKSLCLSFQHVDTWASVPAVSW